MAAAYCSQCGRPFQGAAAFCSRCGAPRTGVYPATPGWSGPVAPYPAGPAGPPSSGSSTAVVVVIVVVLIVGGAAIAGAFWIGSHVLPVCSACPGDTPIGSALEFGGPSPGLCPSNDTYAEQGCQGSTHYEYRVPVLESTVTLGNFELYVETSAGAVDQATGGLGFTILGATGTVLAQYASVDGWMSMNTTWTYAAGSNPATPLTTASTIVIDMGTGNPEGLGLNFIAQGAIEYGYTGTTAPIALP